MPDAAESMEGILFGQSIKLDRPPELPDGSRVHVVVRRAKLSASEREAKLHALFGACSEDVTSLDEFLKWNQEQRRLNRHGEEL